MLKNGRDEAVVDRIFELVGTERVAKRKFADYVGVPPTRISDWKAGRVSSYRKRTAEIAEYFGVTEDWLLGEPQEEVTESQPLRSSVTLDRILQLVGTQYGSKHKFCQAIGMGDSTVQNWRGGYNASYLKHLPEIAALYGVSEDWLLGVDDCSGINYSELLVNRSPAVVELVRVRMFNLLETGQRSLAELGNRLGVSYGTCNNWRCGNSKSYMTRLPEIAAYLEVATEWLTRPLDAGELLMLGAHQRAFKDKTMERIASCIPKVHGKKRELAEALGVSPAAVTAWLTERSKGYLIHLPEIADYYDVSLAWLSGCSETKY